MQEGQITKTALGDRIEIKSIGTVYAKVYQLDEDNNRIRLFQKKEWLEGRITINETKLLDL